MIVLQILKAKKMKKLVAFMFVAVAAISLASCHDKTANNAGNNDSDSIQQVDTANAAPADSAAADSAK